MHFSIPDTEDFRDENGAAYTGYNLHVNGVFHCTVRYSQLFDFQEQVKKEYGTAFLGPHKFPPKKLLSLSPPQIDERRLKLEKYVQILSQDSRIANSDLFNGFLLSAQKETRKEDPTEVQLNVYLMNGHKITVDIMSTDQTDDCLEAVAAEVGLPDDFVYYFALFLMKRENDDDKGTIVRRIQDFESPFISMKAATGKHKIVLRKKYWDSAYDDELVDDRVALQLLYVQIVSDVERGWVEGTKEQLSRLEALKAKGSKKEYLKFARTLKFYGFIQFKSCKTDYPADNTPVMVCAGNKELIFRVAMQDGSCKEGVFRITRMRCWRITTVSHENNTSENEHDLELAFEYLVAKNKLQWITIASEQAILMSLCLQDMVDELVMKKKGARIKRPQDRIKGPQRIFKGRDGGVITASSSSTPVASPDPPSSPLTSPTEESPSKAFKGMESVKRISDKLQSVSVNSKSKGPGATVENDIFEGIGEDDL
ncbi:sorting nexin-17-like [Amphiura filiformis]|uniref:sorting nexin-17-like n=1 Tax=Amphiura filiformis TaxID=82378 RepID=UPI003B212617